MYLSAALVSVLRFELAGDLAPTVLAGNNKAALYGVLASLASLPECCYVFWGLHSNDPRQLVLLLSKISLPHHSNGSANRDQAGTEASQTVCDQPCR